MKKIITLTLALTLSFGGFAQQYNLGKVSFATDSVWIISGNGITQIWSDAVQTDSCSNKTTFDGGDWDWKEKVGNFNIDCRSNPNYKGDLFSWRAVSEFKNELCSAPWRVPTIDDFNDLMRAMGNTENLWRGLGFGDGFSPEDLAYRDKFLNDWGGIYAGYSVGSKLMYQGEFANYWSQSNFDAVDIAKGFGFEIRTSGVVGVTTDFKYEGKSLRCVRDNK